MFVCRARVRSQAELQALQPAPQMSALIPGQDVVIQMLVGVDHELLRQLGEHEASVLQALAGKPWVPTFHGSFSSQEVGEGSRVMRPCANLIMG